MKQDEAKEVIKLMLTADGGCQYCVSDLLKLFCTEFPEHKELAKKAFRKMFGIELESHLDETKLTNNKTEKYHLHGWDDEKVYFWDGKEDRCVSDDEELYNQLLEMCIKYFKKKSMKE